MSGQVFSEKLRLPKPGGLSRPRLERLLLDPSHADLALVVAPAGAGKTTLLARTAAAARMPVAWYRTDSTDVGMPALVAHLSQALTKTLRTEPLPSPERVDDLLAVVDRAPPAPALLVVDDLHEIAGSAAEQALERFISLRPPSLRVLLGARRPPSLNAPRLVVSGYLTEIVGDDLRFRTWEVEELFRTVYGEPLSPELAAALTRRTGGWAAALQLFHLATTGLPAAAREQAVADLSGRSRRIRSYLTRNVLDEMPADQRNFLIRTSALGGLTGELCDELLETTGSGLVLENLARQQLFTTSDDDGRSYRYHQVLQSHLEVLLVDELGTGGARLWYARSAQILARSGEVQLALRASARAEDWDCFRRLIQRSAWSFSGGEDEGWDSQLPVAMIENDPWLTLAAARRQFRRGALDTAAASYARAAELLDEPDFRRLCNEEAAIVALWSTPPPADVDTAWTRRTGSRWLAGFLRAATRRTSLPGGLPGARSSASLPAAECVALGTAMLHLLAGRAADALQIARTAPPLATPPTIEQIGARLVDAAAGLLAGRRDHVPASLEEVALAAEAVGHIWLGRIGRGLQGLALLLEDPAPWRAQACADLVFRCEQEGDDWGTLLLALCTGAAYGRTGQPDAVTMLQRALRLARQLEAPVLAVWAGAAIATLTALDRPGPDQLQDCHRVLRECRVLGVPGAQAIAMLGLARATPGPRGVDISVSALELARECGLDAVEREGGTTARRVRKTHLATLGGFQIEVDGESLPLGCLRPRARSLLRLLALHHGENVHRERLIEALWPGVSPEAGTRRLQVAVSSIRQAFETSGFAGTEILVRQGDSYRLSFPGAEVDHILLEERRSRAAAFRSSGDVAAAAAECRRALDLYRGELLPEDGPAEWVVQDRERLRLAAAAAAFDAARDSRDIGDFPSALRAATRSVELDPFRDLAWDLLADIHQHNGDAVAATMVRLGQERMRGELGISQPTTRSRDSVTPAGS